MSYQKSYLLVIQFLGFRLHGWQKQPNLKTVHFIVDKTLKFVLGQTRFKTVGVGRTDAKVSASSYPLQLLVDEQLDKSTFLELFNENSPADLQLLDVKEILDTSFNIIQHKKIKEYHYYFSNQGKNHPFCAPLMTGYQNMNIELMKVGAKLFEETHYFGAYCSKPSEATQLIRTIDLCQIEESNRYQGNGFLRYHVRLMMGALVEVGKGHSSLDEIQNSLIKKEKRKIIERLLLDLACSSFLAVYSY